MPLKPPTPVETRWSVEQIRSDLVAQLGPEAAQHDLGAAAAAIHDEIFARLPDVHLAKDGRVHFASYYPGNVAELVSDAADGVDQQLVLRRHRR